MITFLVNVPQAGTDPLAFLLNRLSPFPSMSFSVISLSFYRIQFGRHFPPCLQMRFLESKSSYCACPSATLLHGPGQTTTTSCNILKCCVKNFTIFKFEPTTPNMSQHVATRWPNARNMLRPTMLGYVALNVAIVWPGLYVTSIAR